MSCVRAPPSDHDVKTQVRPPEVCGEVGADRVRGALDHGPGAAVCRRWRRSSPPPTPPAGLVARVSSTVRGSRRTVSASEPPCVGGREPQHLHEGYSWSGAGKVPRRRPRRSEHVVVAPAVVAVVQDDLPRQPRGGERRSRGRWRCRRRRSCRRRSRSRRSAGRVDGRDRRGVAGVHDERGVVSQAAGVGDPQAHRVRAGGGVGVSGARRSSRRRRRRRRGPRRR